MAIALRSATVGSTGSAANTVLAAPGTIVNGDILIAGIVTSKSSSGGGATVTAPAGFTQIGTDLTYNSGGFITVLTLWWKRAASESGSYTFTHVAADNQGWIGSYSGCLASGTPVGTPSQNSGTGITTTGLGITTGSNGSWLIYCAADYNFAGGLLPPVGMTERNDSYFYLADELRATAGATGNRTQVNSNGASDPWLAYMVELIIAAAAGDTLFAQSVM